MSKFVAEITALHPAEAPSLGKCRVLILPLLEELEQRVEAQEDLNRRVLQALLLNQHVLVEGLPGYAKTTAVRTLALAIGLRNRRLQFRPDMIPADLIGRHRLVLRNGVPDLEWRHGPLYAGVIVADEINRASAKAQATLLETMQERQVTRIDLDAPELVLHPADLKEVRRRRLQTCYGVEIDRLAEPASIQNTVFATQNPIEQEGTYPLPEAQLDRFIFKLLVSPPPVDSFDRILERNLRPETPPARAHIGLDPPLWVRTCCLLLRTRDLLLFGGSSVHHLMMDDRKGLVDRLKLAILLSHYRGAEGAVEHWGNFDPKTGIDAVLQGMSDDPCKLPHVAELVAAVRRLLAQPIFRHVEYGSSPRGLIDWPRAAIVEAFLDDRGDAVAVRRRHFRVVAQDVLRHRIRLSPLARIEAMSTDRLIEEIVQVVFPDAPDEDVLDRDGFLPRRPRP